MGEEKKKFEFEVEELREIVKKKTLANAELKEQLYDAEATIALLRGKVESATKQLEPLEKLLKEVQNDKGIIFERNENQKGIIKALEQKLATAKEERDKYCMSWEETKAELEKKKTDLKEIKTMLKDLKKKI